MHNFTLTLGGGGAYGTTHIGILLELERIGARPSLITGTSIGGMVAALYAGGCTVDDIADFMDDLRLSQVFALPRNFASVAANRRLEKLLEKRIGRPTFADLNIPIAVVATDLVNRTYHVMNSGDVLSAVLASAAIPGLLPVVERDGKYLIDGGVTNNTPANVARQLGAKRVIAIDVSNTAPYGTKYDPGEGGNLLQRGLSAGLQLPTLRVLLATIDILMENSLKMNVEQGHPDVLLRPYLGTIGPLDFHRLQEGIEAGRIAFLAQKDAILQLLQE